MDNMLNVIPLLLIAVVLPEDAECAEANDFCFTNLTDLGGIPDAIEVPSDSFAAFSQDLQVIALCTPSNILLKCNDSRFFTFSDGDLGTANISCSSDYKIERQKTNGDTEELKSLPPCLGRWSAG
ncbi:hypothetical protein FHG87_014473 [Trinorchestia longiramus]|nr:hypothetical protein FHG87_014473 [Trinorchestia longiramus]